MKPPPFTDDVQAALEATFNARGEIGPDTGDALGEICARRLEMIRQKRAIALTSEVREEKA
jgi:hypothetical protein